MTELRTVAALYVDPRGPYPKMPGVDCYDESRDARLYDGPHPVVAHPPCGPWSKLRHLCKEETADCGPLAVDQVRRFGGVLEQPEHSKLWDECELPKPLTRVDVADCLQEVRFSHNRPDEHGGFSLYVEQVAWGHPCVKPTWLYLVRAEFDFAGFCKPKREPTHCVCTGPRQLKRLPVASKPMKRRTPPLFAEWLISLARSAA